MHDKLAMRAYKYLAIANSVLFEYVCYTDICQRRKAELAAIKEFKKSGGTTYMAHVYDAIPAATANAVVVHGDVNVSSQYGIVRGTNYGRIGGHNPMGRGQNIDQMTADDHHSSDQKTNYIQDHSVRAGGSFSAGNRRHTVLPPFVQI